MAPRVNLSEIVESKQHHKRILIACVVLLIILELFVYLIAAAQAGEKSWVVITDAEGNKVYETRGVTLTAYEKIVFESTFGPLQGYRIGLRSEIQPFPLRGWLVAAIGIPITLTLLVSFLIHVYLSLLYGEKESREEKETYLSNPVTAGFWSTLAFSQRLSIFHIGAGILLVVLLLWMVPNLLGDLFKVSINTIADFKWFFLAVFLFLGLAIVWVIYLRYRLSRKMLENDLEIQKFRIEKQLLIQRELHLTELPDSIHGEQRELKEGHQADTHVQ